MKKKWYEIIDSVSFSLIVLLFSYFFIAIGSIESANEIVSKSKEIDDMFKLTLDTLKDRCSSLDVSLLETRDRLVK